MVNNHQRFIKGMTAVYGPFAGLSANDAARWTPPDDPGAGGHRGRYLWTDAFGVINFITLFKVTSSPLYLTLAQRLVHTVHDVLGKTRDGSARLPGATDSDPLKGGLRIGKMSATGSDGDGQYHHYLTLWMFALNRLSIASSDPHFNNLAIQLAEAIHPHFMVKTPAGNLRMVWKISMDMKHVLVPSQGHLDAATGFVIYRLLQQTATTESSGPILRQEVADYAAVMQNQGSQSPSGDFLDLGMGLWVCNFCPEEAWATEFHDEALRIARAMMSERSATMRRDASRRLAFREFGACLGIRCSDGGAELEAEVAGLPDFWEKFLQEETDEDLKPISWVMYSAALEPGAFRDGFLEGTDHGARRVG